MSLFFPPFFQSNEYFIDEKIQFFKFHNHYNVFDGSGLQIGSVVQRVSGWHKFLRLFLNKQMFPFHLEIIDSSENVLVAIYRGWTFWMSKIVIKDANGLVLGYIRQKFKLFKPTFRIFNSTEIEIGLITGDWKAWNFEIKDLNGSVVGTINKKWAGAMKEIFTTADKYRVSIVPGYDEDTNKINIVSTAIIVDMVMKEGR
ncbi:MAG TPA: phospholipid scramblase-related protein [Chitinophagaceae bacterium]|jgi:uncharacterized protein YxjI|nr:phospholipid scramblase-related protein [Chitinophagaceae bacterium]